MHDKKSSLTIQNIICNVCPEKIDVYMQAHYEKGIDSKLDNLQKNKTNKFIACLQRGVDLRFGYIGPLTLINKLEQTKLHGCEYSQR